MTRKDFEAIAHIIRLRVDQPDVYDHDTMHHVTVAMADYLYTTNPRFDRGRFMRTCGF